MYQGKHGSFELVTACHVVIEEDSIGKCVLALQSVLDQVYRQPVLGY